MASTLPDGQYKLFIYYYDTHGQTQPPEVIVTVRANGGSVESFDLPALQQQGDIWEVCLIDFPSGRVEPLNTDIPASLARSRYRSDRWVKK